MLSVSVSVARSAFTSLSVPLMVRLVVPGLDTVFPTPPVRSPTARHGCRLSVTVKVSPVVLPLSDRLTPVIASAWPTPIVCAAVGAAITGSPFTVTSIVCAAAALLPKLSVAFSVMVVGPRGRAVGVRQRRQVGVHLAQRAADGQAGPGAGHRIPGASGAVADSTPCCRSASP